MFYAGVSIMLYVLISTFCTNVVVSLFRFVNNFRVNNCSFLSFLSYENSAVCCDGV